MAIRIPEFDTFRAGYASAVVTVYKANTTTEADLFADEAGTAPIPNPQTLTSVTINDVSYGKWTQPVYVGESYELSINTSEQTGIQRYPILTAQGLDVSKAVAKIPGSSTLREIEDHLAQQIWVEDFGVLDSDSANNTTIITAALGAAATLGGGEVLLPENTAIPFDTLTIPVGVNLKGRGRGVTVLQSTESGEIVTPAGARSELSHLTLDGISKTAGSIGINILDKTYIRLTSVEVKRFDVGVFVNGMSYSNWRELQVSDCDTPVHIHGEVSTGGALSAGNIWDGGGVDLGIDAGIEFHYHDVAVGFMALRNLRITNCVGAAIHLEGARYLEFDNLQCSGNTAVIDIRDPSPAEPGNTIRDIVFTNSLFDQGTIGLRDTLRDVTFNNCEFRGNTITLTTARNAVKLLGCTEDSSVTIAGDGTKIIRGFDNQDGASKGVTTGNVATKALSLVLDHGEMCAALVMVTGKQRNGINKASYVFTFTAQKAPATLAYDAQSANFTVGDLITGGTSGATARVIADADGGATGTLTLHSITGVFVDNETITGAISGSATVNGALVAGSVTILDQDVQSTSETDAAWACVAAGSVDEAEIQVTGAAAQTIDWTVSARIMREGS
jgi:hypothetical protein